MAAAERGAGDVPGQRDAPAKRSCMICAYSSSMLISSRSEVDVWSPGAARAQQVGELRQQPVGARHVDLHQRRDRVQGIEEEMRAQLRLELGELRFGKGLLQREQALALFLLPGRTIEAEDDVRATGRRTDQLDAFVDQHVRPGFVPILLAEQCIDGVTNRIHGRDERNDDQRATI